MLSLYEILKASKTGIAPDMWTALAGMNWGGADSGHEIKELTGILPLSFTADGTPLLDYLISGNMSQSGTPTPDSPVMPQGTGERTGNLAYGRIEKANISSDGIMVRTTGYYVAIARVEVGKVYTANSYVFAFYTDEPTIGSVSYNSSRIVAIVGKPTTVTAPITGYVAFRLNIGEQAMLNTGSTALPYEPWGIKIPISSANTTTPVYLGEVQTTRKIKKLVLTGSEDENWNTTTIGTNDYIYRMELSDLPKSGVAPICTHYTGSTTLRWAAIANYEVTTSILNSVAIRHSGLTGVSDWKTYLQQQYAAGTPVTIWYVLANETTGIVNEPIRKIGDYADTVSYEQAEVQIPTLHGNTIIDVLTELKPSEMYIKYQE